MGTKQPAFATPLNVIKGRFLKRYKRFLADVELPSGEIVTAHCPNSGSMKTLNNEGVDAWLTPSDNPKRKLKYTLTMLGLPKGGLALTDTGVPNALVANAVEAGAIPALTGYAQQRREVPYGTRKSRIDLLLEDDAKPPCWVEVKSVTMVGGTPGEAAFPDAKTERGAKHLAELADMAQKGDRAVQFYLVDRTDCHSCSIADEIDPTYAQALRDAVAAGVEVVCHETEITKKALWVGKEIPFRMP